MGNLHGILPQAIYNNYCAETAKWVNESWKTSLNDGELLNVRKFRDNRPEFPEAGESGRAFMAECGPGGARYRAAKGMLSAMISDYVAGKNLKLSKSSGVFSSLGYNFYDLRPPVFLLYPVNVPIRNEMARVGRVNAGVGTAAHWMATRNPGTPYAGASEGHRVGVRTPDNNQYVAAYKEIGVESDVTFTAEFAGEGFADNLADEHLRGLQALWLQEEGMMLLGNGGANTISNGFNLGTPLTPTVAAKTLPVTPPNNVAQSPTIAFAGSTSVSVAVVALTGMGYPANGQYGYLPGGPTVLTGLTTVFPRQNADGSVDQINGGISAVSAMSSVATGDTTHVVLAQVNSANLASGSSPLKGAYGYAWYVNTTDASSPLLSNAYLYAITRNPWVVITGTPTGSQSAQALINSNPGAVNTDRSYNPLDFDGLLTWTASGGSNASATGGYYVDLQGATLTSGKDGTVNEVETLLETLYISYQTGIDDIWGSPDAVLALQKAIRYSGTQASGFQFITTRDGQNNLLGGFVVSGYQSRFQTNSPTGANVIPIRMHPMIPPGTLFFDVKTNPYPHSREPYVRSMLVQRDYYSIEWPLVTRQYTFGTYAHEVLAHNMPWITGVITGIGGFVGN